MNQLEKLGLIMIKCMESVADEGGYMDASNIDVYPDLTDEQWDELKAVLDDLTEN